MTEDVFERLNGILPAPSVVIIGAFDGVHLGHQHLLGLARESANRAGARVVAVTFEPLPIQLFRPEAFPGRITTAVRRGDLLRAHGADVVIELPFTEDMSKVSAERFMEKIIAIGPLLDLWVGEDFALGHKRAGTPDRLAELTSEHGTRVHAVPRVNISGTHVSSSAIRNLIQDGQAEEAANIMGHRFQVQGEVVRGSRLGHQIGFPTANVEPPPDMVAMKDGIYASRAMVAGADRVYDAMTYIGTRPAANTGARMIETNLLDFDGDLYGQVLVTEFISHLRHDANFPNLAALQEQLKQDEVMARKTLKEVQEGVSFTP